MLIDGFDKLRNNIATSYMKVGDESTSSIIFRATEKGYLPHLSYIFYKPDTICILLHVLYL